MLTYFRCLPQPRSCRSAWPILLLLLATAASANEVVVHESPACALRPGDTVWSVSSRGLPCSAPSEHVDQLRYQVLADDGCWHATDREALRTSDDLHTPTIVWVPGNRSTSLEARRRGLALYRAMLESSRCPATLRFIIFEWPSDRIAGGQLEDVRVKAARTPANSYYLAWLIGQIAPQVPVSLVGHSFGARIITGALHLQGGGKLNGWTFAPPQAEGRVSLRAVLTAAALDNDWLLPGHCHGMALSQVSHLAVFYNSCDRVLKRYRLLYRRGDARSLGYTGLVGLNCLGPDRAKVRQFDVCCQVGKFHSWDDYRQNSQLMAWVCAEALPEITSATRATP